MNDNAVTTFYDSRLVSGTRGEIRPILGSDTGAVFPQQSPFFDLRSGLGLLKRQYKLVLLSLFVVVALATLLTYALTPIYTASTLVLVDPSKKNLLSDDDAVSAYSGDSARVDSEVRIIRSASVMLSVVDQLSLVSDKEFGVKLGWREKLMDFIGLEVSELPSGEIALQKVVDGLQRAVSVNRQGQTFLIEVTADSEDPVLASKIANAIADTYIQQQVTAKVNGILQARDILSDRISVASHTVANSETQLDEFIFANLERIAEGTGRSELLSMQSRMGFLEARAEENIRLSDLVQTQLDAGNWLAVTDTLQTETLSPLRLQHDALRQQMDELGDDEDALAKVRSELTTVEAQIEEAAGAELNRLEQSIITQQNSASDLRREIINAALASNLPAEILTEIYRLQQDAQIARSQYQTLLQRFRELEAQASLQVADSRVVSASLPPASPSFPNKKLILAFAGIAGLAIGVGLAFLSEHYVGGFTSEAQMRAVLRLPVLAVVPRMKNVGSDEIPTADLIYRAPLSRYSESIRRIRAGVDQLLLREGVSRDEVAKGPKGRVLMVCSAIPEEGKTTMALSLARAYAMSGQRTLLIDCDLRRPNIHRQVHQEQSAGLFEYLAEPDGANSLSGILSKDKETTLDLILGARQSRVPTDQLLTGRRFSSLVESARQHFDVIILDTPPIGPVVDGVYLAKYADVIGLVVKWAGTTQSDVRQALERLDLARRPGALITSVLFQAEERKKKYRGKYDYYYEDDY